MKNNVIVTKTSNAELSEILSSDLNVTVQG
jgi:hypothetical protein